MSTRRRYRVGVVGFGVGGAAVALTLSRAGHEVTVFDRSVAATTSGAAIVLQPSGAAVLERLGLLDLVRRDASPIEDLRIQRHDGRVLLHVNYDEFAPGCIAYGVHRGRLLAALQSSALEAGVRFHPALAVTGLQDDDTSLETTAGKFGPYDFIVAADGARSPLRGRSRVACRMTEGEYGSVWFDGPCLHPPKLQLHIVARGRLLGLIPSGNGRSTLYWGLNGQEEPAWRAAGVEAWRSEIARLYPPAAEMLSDITSLESLRFVRHFTVRMTKWHAGRVVFVGDAGHAIPPHLGQGANLALMDAETLAQSLSREATPAEAFKKYAQLRRAQLHFYTSALTLLTPLVQSPHRVFDYVRDFSLSMVHTLPTLRRHVWHGVTGQKRGWLCS
jgi:2-polyprenyl-6-methoxyphenol hydroxylase-like FAD-dependent oxidoreductase